MSAKSVCGISCGAMHEFALVLDKAGFDADLVQKIVNSKRNKMAEAMFAAVSADTKDCGLILTEWQEFYRKYFGIELNLGETIQIQERRRGFDRLIVVAKGLTNNQVYDTCAKHFPCWRYVEDLNSDVPTNERDPKNGTYAIWVRDCVEADEVHKNKSADMVKAEGLKTETLLERMIHELKYFLETGKHLDVANWTLCSGSRFSDGYVPYAGWLDDGFKVDWYGAGGAGSSLRCRVVVTL